MIFKLKFLSKRAENNNNNNNKPVLLNYSITLREDFCVNRSLEYMLIFFNFLCCFPIILQLPRRWQEKLPVRWCSTVRVRLLMKPGRGTISCRAKSVALAVIASPAELNPSSWWHTFLLLNPTKNLLHLPCFQSKKRIIKKKSITMYYSTCLLAEDSHACVFLFHTFSAYYVFKFFVIFKIYYV